MWFFGSFTIIVIFIISFATIRIQGRPQQIKSGCRFENRRYQEGAAVTTSGPCLQCKCSEGSLRCRLRVCPRLPNPPPPGCRARPPGENACCSELVCGESDEAANVLRRINLETESRSQDDGCFYQGVRYGPGSAMMGSQMCEYCYCISGTRRCIRPKCLLPLPGCTPVYAPHSCCPVSYNCTRAESSTTMASLSGNGCRVGKRFYKEGEMVRDIALKSTCDNCFCAMGVVSCVPLACAPPLQGCSPIVREGQCCPSTYNCSGSIEVKAAQNYASYAFISKDYAKFRKETNFFAPYEFQSLSNHTVEGRGHRVVIEGIDSSTFSPVTEESTVAESTFASSTLETETMDNKILTETTEYPKTTTLESNLLTSTTLEESTDAESTVSDWGTTIKDLGMEDSTLTSSLMSLVDSTTIDDSFSEVTTTRATTIEEDYTSTLPSATDITESTLISLEGGFRESSCQEGESEKCHFTEPFTNDTETTVFSLTTKKQNKDKEEDVGQPTSTITTQQDSLITTGLPSVLMPNDILVMNVTVKTNVSVGHIQGVTINPTRTIAPEIEAILNIIHRQKGDDYEYDYSEPTLPPSLPNVRIIPFVAADALVKDKNEAASLVTGYPSVAMGVPPELIPKDSTFYDVVTQENRFSPPVETEGGFVPREPPYYDQSYHSIDLNLEIGTGVTVIPEAIGNPLKKNDLQDLGSICIFEGHEYHHAATLPSPGFCVVCICYYGEVICSDEKCPPLKIGCQKIIDEKNCCGKIVCVDAKESPTVVLDRSDSSSQIQPLVSLDPFRDVIKTEPAPDLPSLIEDMIPYLAGQGINTSNVTNSLNSSSFEAVQSSKLYSFQERNQSHEIDQHFPESASEFYRLNDTILSSLQDYDYNNRTSEVPLQSNFVIRNNQSEKNSSNLMENENSLSNNETSNKTEGFFQSVENDSIFSLDSVLDLFFSDSTTEITKIKDIQQTEIKNSEVQNSNVKSEFNKEIKSDNGSESKKDAEVTAVKKETESLKTDIKEQSKIGEKIIIKEEVSIKNQSTKEKNIDNLKSNTKLNYSSEHPSLNIINKTNSPTTPISIQEITNLNINLNSEIKAKNSDKDITGLNILKLAGCNIYGRMYRVGRIITELTSSCRECKCTEVGVQCKQLKC
ncbi:uncharacterized protein LOC127280274 [Leptopilina boulardi]|uniref:uncharacterized protein LOC127280274 n=1 Tax=Leptopilina boulardi TaxID=63433 RepID=UPI0021F66252|nr:uncharacterized protein LOC127280274 [Leptopilina boulardi]